MNAVRLLALFVSPLAGCAAVGVKMPDGFAEQSRPLEIDHAFFGVSGTRFDGFELDGGMTIGTGSGLFGPQVLDASDELQILREGDVAWRARCTSKLDTGARPAGQMTCLFMPATPADPPMTLALSSSTSTPLRGVFFAAGSTWIIEGTMDSDIGSLHPTTVGYAFRRPGQREVVAFVDLSWGRLDPLASSSLTPAEVHALAPLFLTMIQIRDARFMLRSDPGRGNQFTFTDDGLVSGRRLSQAEGSPILPLPPPAHAGSTVHEQHAAQLIELGFGDAARVLWAALIAQRTPRT